MTQPCIIWPGRLDRDGYGVVSVGEHRRAHRLTYALYVGAIPAGMAVLHSCDVPSCVNPAHLRIGTPADNARDRTERRRMPRSWLAKMTDEQVAEIRAGLSARDAMAKFGIAKSAYYAARAGHTYRPAKRLEINGARR